MISLFRIERLTLFVVLLTVLVPLAYRSDKIGVPLYSLPMLFLLSIWMLRLVQEKSFSIGRAIMAVPFLIAALLMGASTLASANGVLNEYTIWLTGFGVLFYANQNWMRTFDYRFILKFAFIAAAIQVSVSFAQIATTSYVGNIVMYFGQRGDITEDIMLIGGERVIRAVGTVGAQNMLTTILAMMSALIYPAAVGYVHVRKLYRIIAIALIASSLILAAVSTSRVTLAIMVLLPAVFSILHSVRTKNAARLVRLAGIVIVFLFLTGSLLVVLFLMHRDEIVSTAIYRAFAVRMSGFPTSITFRMEQYLGALSAIHQFPLSGMGFGSSAHIWDLLNIKFTDRDGFSRAPHNVYLVIALEAGLIAGIVFAGALFKIFIDYCRWNVFSPRYIDSLFVALGVFAVASLFYLVPLSRSLWPLGCLLIGILQAEVHRLRRMQINNMSHQRIFLLIYQATR